MNPKPLPLLEMRDVRKRFGGITALDGVTFGVGRGEVRALIGENGAGKSTLMKILSGAYRPDSGEMTLEGEPYAPRGPRDALARGVAMIYQELNIAPHLSVEANILLGQEKQSAGFVRRAEHRRIVEEVLTLLDHPDIRPDIPAGRLSVAARQLVEVARALVSNAKVIVFDEPTSSLTERDALKLFEVIDRLKEKGLAIVYISHFLEEARRVASVFTVLRDGRAIASGETATTTLQEIIRAMVGRELTEMFPRVPHEIGETVLDLSAVSGRRLPRNVSMTLRRGQILGIFGLVGSGRTELLRALFGLDAVRSGVICVRGRATARSSPRDRIRSGFGLLSEDRKSEGLAISAPIEDNLTLSSLGKYARRGFLDLGRRRKVVAGWIETLRIRAKGPGQIVGALSGGNQQKVAIARLLHQDAEILLLDEPTRGIDVGSKSEIYRLIGELASKGKCVVVVSSYLPELLGICDSVAVMSRGTLGEARDVKDWTEESVMAASVGG